MRTSTLGSRGGVDDLLPQVFSREGRVVEEDGLQVGGVQETVRADHGYLFLPCGLGHWGRVRGEEHGGAVRRGTFKQSLQGVTPPCVRCNGLGKKSKECFIVTEEMDVEEEEEDDNVDTDSGMETEGELELFPEE